MANYIIYDATTGKLKRTVACAPSMSLQQLREGEALKQVDSFIRLSHKRFNLDTLEIEEIPGSREAAKAKEAQEEADRLQEVADRQATRNQLQGIINNPTSSATEVTLAEALQKVFR